MRFRKKPVEVDAIPVADILNGKIVPEWAINAMTVVTGGTDKSQRTRVKVYEDHIDIWTVQDQIVESKRGEWLVRANSEDLWPVDGEVFARSYELANA